MILKTYQQIESYRIPKTQTSQYATISGVYDDGVSLLFDNAAEGSIKHYPINKNLEVSIGDRVKIEKAGGSYIVAYALGGAKDV